MQWWDLSSAKFIREFSDVLSCSRMVLKVQSNKFSPDLYVHNMNVVFCSDHLSKLLCVTVGSGNLSEAEMFLTLGKCSAETRMFEVVSQKTGAFR